MLNPRWFYISQPLYKLCENECSSWRCTNGSRYVLLHSRVFIEEVSIRVIIEEVSIRLFIEEVSIVEEVSL